MKIWFCLFLFCTQTAFASGLPRAFPVSNISVVPLQDSPPLEQKKWKGSVVLIDFWASWCHACREAIPYYNELAQKWAHEKVLVLGINADDSNIARDQFLKEVPIKFPIYADPNGKLAKALQADALPQLFILNKKSEIVAVLQGFKKDNEKEIENKIRQLLK